VRATQSDFAENPIPDGWWDLRGDGIPYQWPFSRRPGQDSSPRVERAHSDRARSASRRTARLPVRSFISAD